MSQPAALSKAEVLAQLKTIEPPLEPSFWPPSWEFWLFFLIIIGAIIGLVIALLRWRGPLWFRTAKKQMKLAYTALQQQPNQASLLQLNQILKQVAITIHGREIAHLQGQTWCQWLDSQGSCNHFTQGVGQCFGEQVYNPQIKIPKTTLPLLKTVLFDWLQHQKNLTPVEVKP